MNKLQEMIEAVREQGLTKSQLEQYHTEITYLDSIMRTELAPIEKEEALFFHGQKVLINNSDSTIIERPDVVIKRMWRATEKGQRQIELSHYLKITPKLLASLKTRLYGMPY